jgi:hypothetical protein
MTFVRKDFAEPTTAVSKSVPRPAAAGIVAGAFPWGAARGVAADREADREVVPEVVEVPARVTEAAAAVRMEERSDNFAEQTINAYPASVWQPRTMGVMAACVVASRTPIVKDGA